MKNPVGLVTWMALLMASCGSNSTPNAGPPVDSIAVAPLDQALTFARAPIGDTVHLIAVLAYDDATISGVDLTSTLNDSPTDPIDVFNAQGYEPLQRIIERASPESQVTVATKDLEIPVALTTAHIAAGTNFADHAEEATVEDGPFLFAKLVEPTGPFASVSVGNALLDYEVELAFVTLKSMPLDQSPQTMGLILCNDFTDRATLLRHIDPSDVTSGIGFTTGKSAPGFLPVGNLFVIPRDLRAFVAGINLHLSRNDEPRQSAPMSYAIWDLDELFKQTRARENTTWDHHGDDVRLPIEDSAVPARTLFMAGTPGGTVFAGIPKSTIARGALRWAFGGWSKPVAARVVENYIATARKRADYLQPGDHVAIRVNQMGEIRTAITE